jgi:hypothetical protein
LAQLTERATIAVKPQMQISSAAATTTSEPKPAARMNLQRGGLTMYLLSELVAREHTHDLLREARHEQEIHAAHGACARSHGLYGSAMVWLGRWMVAWGWRLRVRYGAIEFCEDAS